MKMKELTQIELERLVGSKYLESLECPVCGKNGVLSLRTFKEGLMVVLKGQTQTCILGKLTNIHLQGVAAKKVVSILKAQYNMVRPIKIVEAVIN